MTETMIVRMARIMAAEVYGDADRMVDKPRSSFDVADPDLHRSIIRGVPAYSQFLALAVKVVATMREPTDAMTVDAIEYEAVDGRATSQHIWRAMIDQALAECA